MSPTVSSVTPEAVRQQVERLVASPQLVNSAQLCRFLRHVVERTLAGDTSSLKENLLGTEVFERGDRFDPRIDPVVRVEARRLRAKIDEYYGSAGAGDPVVIRLPKGTYVPVFETVTAPQPTERVEEAPDASSDKPADSPAAPPSRWRWVVPVGAAAVIAAVAGALWLRPAPVAEASASVAVLPFANVGGDSETEYFADGLTDELIDVLGHSGNLRVVARSSVFQFKGRTGDARGVAQQLNAGYLLEGSVRKEGGRLRIIAQLIDARNGYQLWSETLDRDPRQVFSIRQEIATAIAAKLHSQTNRERSRRYTENLECYNAYLKGRFHWNKRTVSGFEAAIAAFQQAIEKDAAYAPAWAGLADSYCMLGFMNVFPPLTIRQKAMDAADRALQLDDRLAEAHVARGNILAVYDWNYSGGEQSFRRALAIDPRSPEAHYSLSKTLATIGRMDQAISEMQRAQELDPLSLITVASLGWELAKMKRYRESDDAFKSAHDLDPNFIWAYTLHAWSYEARGQYDDAIAELRKGVSLSESSTVALGELAHALGRSGRKQEAQQVLDRLLASSKQRYVAPFDLSRAFQGLGRTEEAVNAMSKACDERSPMALFAKDPVFEPLWAHPRFVELLKRMGLQ